MIKKTLTYTDYNDVERTEDFYFNLTEAELAEMELETEGGLGEYIQRIVAAKNQAEIVKLFKKLILRSYGIKSPDGRRFTKSEEISKEFTETEAYSILFMELATDSKAGSDFLNGIIPKRLSEQIAKES